MWSMKPVLEGAMAYFRNVIAKSLPFEVVNIAIGEQKLAVRLLCKVEDSHISESTLREKSVDVLNLSLIHI